MIDIKFPIKEWLWPNFSSFIFVLLMLLYSFWLFKKFLFKPTRDFIAKRQKYLANHIKKTEQLHALAKNKLQDANIEFAQVVKDSKLYLAQQMEKANNQASELVNKAKSNIKMMKHDAQKSLQIAETKAQSKLKKEVVDLSIAMAKKILHGSVDEKKSKQLVDDFIKEVK